ncbi:RING finger protein 11 isoform X1 [Hyperolius riggenbachi]|uniref:RING finger protein 11 isoform X1 n=1 Tax=Hyperolius riggenbachi TaxID=752182 RepID=UPI0035A27191
MTNPHTSARFSKLCETECERLLSIPHRCVACGTLTLKILCGEREMLRQSESPIRCIDGFYEEQAPVPVYHPTPSQTRLATQLTEEEQIRIAQRIGLIQHLPKGVYDPGRDGSEKKIRECVICMMDFVYGDPIRFLPCMHIYHMDCIDDWLMRSFTCPSCMEPVDAALLSSYETN